MTTTFDWNFRSQISILKGAKLPVLLALMLHSNLNLRCYPSTRLLCAETGLSSAPVTKALKDLEAMKAIIKVPYHKRTKGEMTLPLRKTVFQLTGVIYTKELKTRYLSIAHLNDETLDALAYIISDIDKETGKQVIEVLESEILEYEILDSKSKGSTSSKGSTVVKDKKSIAATSDGDATDSNMVRDVSTVKGILRCGDPDCDGKIKLGGTYYHDDSDDGYTGVLCPGCYLKRTVIEWNDSVHDDTLGDYIDGESDLVTLTAEQAEVLEYLQSHDTPNLRCHIDSTYSRYNAEVFKSIIITHASVVDGCWHITDTGRAALEAHKVAPPGAEIDMSPELTHEEIQHAADLATTFCLIKGAIYTCDECGVNIFSADGWAIGDKINCPDCYTKKTFTVADLAAPPQATMVEVAERVFVTTPPEELAELNKPVQPKKTKAKKPRTAKQMKLDAMMEAIIAATPNLDRDKIIGGAWSPYQTTGKWLLAREATPEDMATFVPFVISEANRHNWAYSVRCLTGKDRWPKFCGQRKAREATQQQSEDDKPQPLSATDGVIRGSNL